MQVLKQESIYLWNDGRQWYPLQMNLPITPITDLAVKNNDLVAATSGRSFWILDDLDLLRQVDEEPTKIHVYQPAASVLLNGSSELNGNNPSFNGTNPLRGVNPANGAVIYYQLPKSESKEPIELTITTSSGELVRSYSSVKDTTFSRWAGGPPPAPVLGKKEGLNRFVWDLRYPILEGIPDVYIEGSYRRHKVIPGTYNITVSQGEHSSTTTIDVSPHPLYDTTTEQYEEYHLIMSEMEATLSNMHRSVNEMADMRKDLFNASKKLSANDDLGVETKALITKMKNWDDEMVQRKTQAYDDVENFPNKLSANYLFLINQTESDIVKVTEAARKRKLELDEEWTPLREQASAILNTEIPMVNKKLWEAGVGAIKLKKIKP